MIRSRWLSLTRTFPHDETESDVRPEVLAPMLRLILTAFIDCLGLQSIRPETIIEHGTPRLF
jgi:hypothetical protein